MKQYLNLLDDILTNGYRKSDRTNTGTLSVFGRSLRFNLADGFPLVTTKKVHLKSVIHELLWFITGDTNIKYLTDNGVTIWNEWADEDGELGPVYGHAWRRFGAKPRAIPQPKPRLRPGIDATYCGVANGSGSSTHALGKVWQGMIQRCYSKVDIGYANYGGRGVHVCDRWLEFIAFAEDAVRLPGWEEDSETRLVLDKDGVGDGFCYSPENCQWITNSENVCLRSDKIYTVEKDGVEYTFRNPTRFCQEQGIPANNFSDLWTGRKNAQVRHGFRLVSVEDLNSGVDQLADTIDRIKSNPGCRRLIVSAWHPYWNRYVALPPCHMMYQFYVADGRLSCQMYQRSADVFLGVPFNIASYALLTMMVAQVTGLKPGELIVTLGDAHLYLNHLEQARLQLSREPRPLPKMHLNRARKVIDDFIYTDFALDGYDPWPAIKAPVAV